LLPQSNNNAASVATRMSPGLSRLFSDAGVPSSSSSHLSRRQQRGSSSGNNNIP
jgi:hypothetical protein